MGCQSCPSGGQFITDEGQSALGVGRTHKGSVQLEYSTFETSRSMMHEGRANVTRWTGPASPPPIMNEPAGRSRYPCGHMPSRHPPR